MTAYALQRYIGNWNKIQDKMAEKSKIAKKSKSTQSIDKQAVNTMLIKKGLIFNKKPCAFIPEAVSFSWETITFGMPMKKNYCKVCKEPLEGRVDKKFCSDACRCSYFNRVQIRERREFRKIDRILKKNRKILKLLFDAGRLQASHQELEVMGFEFGYATQVLLASESEVRYFCYDLGLSSSPSQPQFSLVRKRLELNEQLSLTYSVKGQGRSL